MASGSNVLLTSENVEAWLAGREKAIKAILFTKKSETPGLWVRVADAFATEVDFGEIRLGETALMQRFGMSESVLPKVVAVRHSPSGAAENILYEGPNELEKIGEFLQDAIGGGTVVVELRREVETLNRELRGLRGEVVQEREAAAAARAEAARIRLGQVLQFLPPSTRRVFKISFLGGLSLYGSPCSIPMGRRRRRRLACPERVGSPKRSIFESARLAGLDQAGVTARPSPGTRQEIIKRAETLHLGGLVGSLWEWNQSVKIICIWSG
jgi:hypothetical protein